MTCNNLGAGEVLNHQFYANGTTLPDIPQPGTLGKLRREKTHGGPINPVGSGLGSSTTYSVICNTQRLHNSTGKGQSADIQEQPPPQMGQRTNPTPNGNQGSDNTHSEILESTTIPSPPEETLRFYT